MSETGSRLLNPAGATARAMAVRQRLIRRRRDGGRRVAAGAGEE